MKVGVFSYGMNERLTGIGRYTVELTRAMAKLDPDLELVLLNPNTDSTHPWYREFETYPLPRLRLLPAAATLGNLELHRAALRLGLDILHDPCGIAPFLAPRGKYRRVTTVHDAIPYLYPRTQPLLSLLIFQSLVRASRFTADAVVTVSNGAANDLSRLAGIPRKKLFVTANGVTPSRPLEKREIEETLQAFQVEPPYYLCVGALHPRKNVPRIIQAFQAYRNAGGGARLVIVGPPYWGANRIVQQVEEHSGNDTGIIFAGFVDDEQLQALYAGARALVFASLYEGFGLPALESMSHGTPVIASDSGSLPEVVGNAGMMVDPLSVSEIENAMHRMATDDELHERLSRRSLERSRHFSWTKTARQTLDLYRLLLD